MKKQALLILLMTFLSSGIAAAQQPQRLTPEQVQALRARYPQEWERKIPEGTRLAAMKAEYDHRLDLIPAKDLEDKSAIPLWFRAYLRDKHPELPTSGPYQYPRWANRLLGWMLMHPDLVTPPSSGADPADPQKPKKTKGGKIAAAGPNINVTGDVAPLPPERNSESSIAAWNVHPGIMIAAANDITFLAQRQFYSGDIGLTWNRTQLPMPSGTAFESDPSVAWAVDGTAWSSTIDIDSSGNGKIDVYKSTDRGATWTFVKTVSTDSNNDKEQMWIDTSGISPYRDNIYVAWDVPGSGMRFARSTDKGATWSSVTTISTASAIGASLTTDIGGHVYVAWQDVASQSLQITKSTDGGATFGSATKIATTTGKFDVGVPAQCVRRALIYPVLAADRSSGPNRGLLYATWTDRSGTSDPGCTITSTSNANVFFSVSQNDSTTWATPVIVHNDPAQTDHFNQWMDVDQNNGAISIIFYSTRDDPVVVPPPPAPATGRTKTNVYYVASVDGGTTWGDEFAVTTAQSNETAAGADPFGNQYGDYNGLVAIDIANAYAHPVWTDRRAGVPSGFEQIFTAQVTRGGGTGPITCSTITPIAPIDINRLILYWTLLLLPAAFGIWLAYRSQKRKLTDTSR